MRVFSSIAPLPEEWRIALKPKLFLVECATELIKMNTKRKPPAIYYACPKGDQLEGALWGSTSVNLLTPTGMTILDTLDANMDDLLHLNRVSICSTIKDLLLNNLDITSVWNTNVNGTSTRVL